MVRSIRTNDDAYLTFDTGRYGAVKRLTTNIGQRTYTHVEAGAVPGLVFISQRERQQRLMESILDGCHYLVRPITYSILTFGMASSSTANCVSRGTTER